MKISTDLYRHSLALLTDLYQLTMAYGYWKLGMEDHHACFHLFFRRNPFHGGYAIAAGLDYVMDFLKTVRFSPTDLAYLAELRGNDENPLFDNEFLDYLGRLEFGCDVDAVPEGTVVFPHEPMVRVTGPLIQCQIIETPLLNMVNFQTLIATKASRICMATDGESVLEFGLRRAQGIDGSLAASRAAFIGGCNATSNVLAGKLFGIPVRGTHSHSWVMCFDDELASFESYAQVMPNNCIFLVDTYDTLDGVRNAVEVGKNLRRHGYEMVGIRLDSGDLAFLSIEARKILDEGGFRDAAIVASNDLDEHIITSLKRQGATISVWGVGTKLATGFDQPALGGVYKMSAVRSPGEPWRYKVKLSEQAIKINNPGIMQVRRYVADGKALFDVMYDEGLGVEKGGCMVDPMDMTRRKRIPADARFEDLLVPIYRKGHAVYESPALSNIRSFAKSQLSAFHGGIKRFVNPHQYPVGLEERLFDRKTRLVLQARGVAE